MKSCVLVFTGILAAAPACAQQPMAADEQQRMEALLEKNPHLRTQIEAMQKRNVRITKWGEQEIAPDPAASTFKGSAETAADAYRRGDYKTAMQHYRSLAAEGDGEASLMVGIMHQQGQGVKKDKAAAYAWYGRASEEGYGAAEEVVRGMNDNDELSDSEYKEAEAKYRELAKEMDEPEAAEGAATRFQEIRDQTNVYVQESTRSR
ncbi:MAG: hypothetical protein ACREUU_02450 [Gammaproteobacteria bacterium]